MNYYKQSFFSLILMTSIALLLLANKDIEVKHPKLMPGEWMSAQRMYPYSDINIDAYQKEMQKALVMNQNTRAGNYEWELVGPTNIGGRITDIEIPQGQSDILYIAAASGGIFKTENQGNSWMQMFQGVPTISIGDLAIDPENVDVIYAGTGEANSSSYSFLGSGIYKSTDGGENWNFSGLENSAYIGRIIVDYNNSDRVFAAACGNLFTPSEERGIYRTIDGGDSWERILFVSDTTAAIDLVQDPSNADVLYAAFWERSRGLTYRRSFGKTTGIYKTLDGGNNWVELTNGLPNALLEKGRLGLSISQTNPQVLYAMYDMPDEETWMYKTENGGDSWQRLNDGYLNGMGSSFGWYFGQVRVHPEDENKVFALGQVMYRSDNSGSSWTGIDNSGVHVDHHAMCFDLNSGRTYLGNDGGLYYSTNFGNSWNKINNLPITQFYAYDVSESNQDFQVGGTQDNNSIRTIDGQADSWEAVLGGDGMYNRINQQNNDIAYAEYQWGNLFHSFDATSSWPSYNYIADNMSGDRNNWSAPLELTPGQNDIAYFGTHRLWRSTDNGSNWSVISGDLTQGGENYFHTLTCIAVSSINSEYIMTGSGDGKVHISTDNGASWNDITDGLPLRWMTDVVFDPLDENTVYATVSGFRWDEPLPHVFKSIDLGVNWIDISGNLPQIPINQLVIDPDDTNELIVGTDAGIYMTVDGGENWESITGNMPMVPIVAFKLIPDTKDLYAATYGISTFKINLNDVNVGIAEYEKSNADFKARWIGSASAGFLEINTRQIQNFDIKVFNMAGQLLLEKSIGRLDKGVHQIQISKMASASSFILIQINGEYGSETLKLYK